MINLKYIETHSPVFLAGTNLSQKLDITKRANLYLQYDEKKEFYLVWFNKNLARLPKTSIHTDVPLDWNDTGYKHPVFDVELEKPQQSAPINHNFQAQVSGPHSHVFREGPGETGIGQKIK